MKSHSILWWIIAIGLTSCETTPIEYINDYYEFDDDNIVEEIGEAIIEIQTGIDVDLSPRTEE